MQGCKEAGIPAFGTLWDFVSIIFPSCGCSKKGRQLTSERSDCLLFHHRLGTKHDWLVLPATRDEVTRRLGNGFRIRYVQVNLFGSKPDGAVRCNYMVWCPLFHCPRFGVV